MGTCGMWHSRMPASCLTRMFAPCLQTETLHCCALSHACMGAQAPMSSPPPQNTGGVSAHTHPVLSCNFSTTRRDLNERENILNRSANTTNNVKRSGTTATKTQNTFHTAVTTPETHQLPNIDNTNSQHIPPKQQNLQTYLSSPWVGGTERMLIQ